MSSERAVTLKDRTTAFALQVIRLYAAMPKTVVAQVVGKQLLRAGTSVGAHHREAMRSRSDAEFVSKIEGAQQELEETTYWLELVAAECLAPADRTKSLLGEADELMAMLAASARTVKAKRTK